MTDVQERIDLRKLTRGCVVRMKASSGLVGYGNEQCVSGVCEPLGTLSLFGHNQHYKIYDVAEIIESQQARIEELEADNRRMDYLESEAIREIDLQAPLSLFRRNMPITRDAVDDALAALQTDKEPDEEGQEHE